MGEWISEWAAAGGGSAAPRIWFVGCARGGVGMLAFGSYFLNKEDTDLHRGASLGHGFSQIGCAATGYLPQGMLACGSFFLTTEDTELHRGASLSHGCARIFPQATPPLPPAPSPKAEGVDPWCPLNRQKCLIAMLLAGGSPLLLWGGVGGGVNSDARLQFSFEAIWPCFAPTYVQRSSCRGRWENPCRRSRSVFN